MGKVAVVIDAGFFLKKLPQNLKVNQDVQEISGEIFQRSLHWVDKVNKVRAGLNIEIVQKADTTTFRVLGRDPLDLHRIYVYDCPPLAKNITTPIGKKTICLHKEATYRTRIELHKTLNEMPHTTIRLGRLSDFEGWQLNKNVTDEIKKAHGQLNRTLTDEDFYYKTTQKGVDMMLGADLLMMALKHQVTHMVLVTNDTDFVPIFKLLRREGVYVYLDPLGDNVAKDLAPHTDGVIS